MHRLCLFLLTVFCFCFNAEAQTVFTGKILEGNTTRPVAGIRITNIANREMVLSDTVGNYRIKAKIGDKLIFEGFAYKTDTLYVYHMQKTTIYLTPKMNELGEVDVKSKLPDMRGWVDTNANKGIRKYDNRDRDGLSHGLKLGLGFFNPFFKKKKNDMSHQKKWEIEQEIDRKFTPFNIARYVPLKGGELQGFCDLYKPLVQTYRSPHFDFVLYINDSYKAFMKLPPEKRKLPPLTGP